MREIIDIKHGGIEGLGIECHYLGTSVPVEKAVDAAIEIGASAILISVIRPNMTTGSGRDGLSRRFNDSKEEEDHLAKARESGDNGSCRTRFP
ncbi:MAG TPA: hypothetical protein GX509_04815 [Firmicutes bacterium]|nr:hypothetical protein [Bacillota bacterium]HHY98041.1 hypothetical protein [Bacillota bacterium]